MELTILDYCDRYDKILLDFLQVLQNRAAKIVLDHPVYSSTQLSGNNFMWDEVFIGLKRPCDKK